MEKGRVAIRRKRSWALLAALAILSGCSYNSSGIHIDLTKMDYSRDVPQREQMLREVAISNYPFIGSRLGRILETGGILAFRDYLIYLAKLAPDKKYEYLNTPLSLGKQQEWTTRIGDGPWVTSPRPSPRLGNIIKINALVRNGILDPTRKYSYAQYAVMIEQTIGNWRPPKEREMYYVAGEAGGTVFWWAGEEKPPIETEGPK